MTETRRLRVVPRAAGDSTPLDPAVAEALRKAGMDPAKFTVAPGGDDVLSGLPKAGTRVVHTFRFDQLNGAFSAMERLLDDQTSARISKATDGWLVGFAVQDPTVDDPTDHRRFNDAVARFGVEDRGFLRESVNVNVTRVSKT